MWKYVRNSANMASYTTEDDSGLFAHVIHNSLMKKDGEIVIKDPPTYSFTVYREGEGVIGEFTYRPDEAPNPQSLLAEKVGELIKEELNVG